jgi:hypothetical protein
MGDLAAALRDAQRQACEKRVRGQPICPAGLQHNDAKKLTMANPHEEDLFDAFGRYKLVARFHTGAHRGWLWRDGKRLIEVQADSNRAAMDQLEAAFYNLLMAKALQHGPASHDEVATAQALLAIWKHRGQVGNKATLSVATSAGVRLVTSIPPA